MQRGVRGPTEGGGSKKEFLSWCVNWNKKEKPGLPVSIICGRSLKPLSLHAQVCQGKTEDTTDCSICLRHGFPRAHSRSASLPVICTLGHFLPAAVSLLSVRPAHSDFPQGNLLPPTVCGENTANRGTGRPHLLPCQVNSQTAHVVVGFTVTKLVHNET